MEGLKSDEGGGRSSDEVDEGEVRGEMGDMTVRPSTRVCRPELLVLIVVVLLAISAMVVVEKEVVVVVVGREFCCRILLFLFFFLSSGGGSLVGWLFYLVLSFTRCGGCRLRTCGTAYGTTSTAKICLL